MHIDKDIEYSMQFSKYYLGPILGLELNMQNEMDTIFSILWNGCDGM